MEDGVRKFRSMLRAPWPVSRLLVLFVAVLALPLLGLIAWEGYRIAHHAQKELGHQALEITKRISADLDQTMVAYITILKTLAASKSLSSNDFEAVYEQARAALEPAGLFACLSSRDGRQLFNTRVPFGSPLPGAGDVDQILFDSKQPYVSDLMIGSVAKHPVAVISVPVMKDGEVAYVFSLSLDAGLFKQLLDQQHLPSYWTASIIDRKGILVARSQRNDEFVGQHIPGDARGHRRVVRKTDFEGRDVILARDRSEIAGWGVAAFVPAKIAGAAVKRAIFSYLAAVAMITGIGFAGAIYLGRLIVRPLADLQKAAGDLGKGEPISFEPSLLREAEAVKRALIQSAEQRKEAESELVLATERFMAAEEGASGYVYDWDATADTGWRSGGFTKLLGWRDDEVPVTLEAWRQLIHPEDRAKFERFAYGQDYRQDRVGMEFRIRHKSGHYVWVWDRGKLFRNDEGVLIRKVGSIIDITPRKTLEEQQALLLRELSHRSKNLLAVIQAVARQTLTASSSTAEAKQALSQRLEALARTYETLTRTPSYQAPIATIVGDELSAFSSRTQIDGPPLFLNPGAAQTMALVVHELATNAAKYGALSVPDGMVAVRWGIEANGKDGTFHFSWTESGGPSVRAPERSGFGSLLTGEIAAMQLGGEAAREFEKAGFRYRLLAPLPAVTTEVKQLPLSLAS